MTYGDEGQALSHEHMAAVLLDLGDARQAIEHLQEAVALYTRKQAEAAADKYAGVCVCVCACMLGPCDCIYMHVNIHSRWLLLPLGLI